MKNFKTLSYHHLALEMDKVLLSLSKFAISKLAKEKCLNLEVLSNKTQIEYELSLVTGAKKIIDNTNSNLPIQEILDIDELFKNSRFLASEIVELSKNLRFSRLVKNFISKNDEFSLLSEIVKNLYTNKELEDEIFNIFDNELNLLDCASDELRSLRNSYKDNKNNLKQAITSLLANPSFCDNLQDTIVSTRDDRPVFQVKASNKNKVQGIVHDISSTNLTYFIEPSQLIPLSNKIKQIEIEIRAEEERILSILSLKFKEIQKEMFENQKILVNLDVIFAKARYSIHLKANPAVIVDEKIIDIQKMAHPLLLDIKSEDEVIRNDFLLGKDYKILLITGSNTGGKTVALKTAGLMVLMSKMGLHIPCFGAKIYPKFDIFCDISKEQSLEQGFSTYSAHIKNIAQILDAVDENSLVLFDELGSGTDPIEGSAISKAILRFLKEKNVLAIITTHLGELKSLKYEDNYFQNATVLFDIETLKPKYSLIMGVSGTSNAIDISKTLGLSEKIIENAREILYSKGENSLNFVEFEKNNQDLIKKQKELKLELEKIEKIKEEETLKLEEIKKNKKKSLENFKRKFQDKMELARSEIKQVVDEIRKEKSLKVAMRSYNRLSNIENGIREDFSTSEDKLSEKFKELDIKNLKIGQNVLIKKLNQVVILDSLPDKKGNVEIRIGNIKSKISIKKLAYTDKKVAPHLKKLKVSFDNSEELLSRLDLRGMRVLEAIEYLDEKLDKASLRGLNQISIIHGFGTGALKQAVWDYLKESPYVAKFYYDGENETKQGCVIVELK